MKNCILAFIFCLPLAALAQVTQGNLFIGGDVSFASTSYSAGGHSSSVYIGPQVGYFITNKSALGGGIVYRNTDDGQNSHSLDFDFFHRLYIPITEKFYFNLHSSVYAGFGKINNGGNPDTDTSDAGVYTRPGFTFFPSRHWGFDAYIGRFGIDHVSNKPDVSGATTTSSTSVSLNAGTVTLGVYYYFNK